MNRIRLKKLVIFVLLIAGILQGIMMTYAVIANGTTEKYIGAVAYNSAQSAIESDTTIQQVMLPKKEIDTSMVVLKKEVEDAIISLDVENATKNLNNYKTLLVALDVPVSFQEQIEYMYFNKYKVADVLIAYEYLYHNFGDIDDFEDFLLLKKSGKSWKEIFGAYKNSTQEFIPTNFGVGKLEETLRIPGITPDDVMIADRIAQQAGLGFDELIAMRSKGTEWKIINEGLGILNTSGELPRVAITSAQIKNCIKSTGLNEEKIIEAFVLAEKLGEDGMIVMEKVKLGKDEEDIIAESLDAKY